MTQRMLLAMLIPILAIVVIIVFAGGLGILFMVMENAMQNEIGVIVLGSAFVVGVPLIAYLLERAVGEPQ
ncbi:MAG: hypothetical protein J4O08_04540 [Chloroflexi bacterium]|nr:hypothetical protein [Chloroflexota bacterium]MCH8868939.1 hypothetical protein [Chloroflexota bacterium]MCI0771172.1 hypothetical protein [Chloroflexota bacterium]MCI0790946.1 hypothetical protein [Chloroflexota bacterium]MCI0795456.1 hypothetical protein [Chloroflexota bacterium]